MAEWLREMSVGEWFEAGGEPFFTWGNGPIAR